MTIENCAEHVDHVAKAMWDVSDKRAHWEHAPPHLKEIYRHRADAAISAMPALTQAEARGREAGIRVKPLVWEDHPGIDGPVMSMAVTDRGTYFICDDTDDFSGLYCEFVHHNEATWFGTVNAHTTVIIDREHVDDFGPIKDMAQAHHDAAVRAMIDTDAPTYAKGREAGIREAAELIRPVSSPNKWTDFQWRMNTEADKLLGLLTTSTPDGDSGEVTVAQVSVDALAAYQQADADGIMVLVSRQAIEECLPALRTIAKGAKP